MTIGTMSISYILADQPEEPATTKARSHTFSPPSTNTDIGEAPPSTASLSLVPASRLWSSVYALKDRDNDSALADVSSPNESVTADDSSPDEDSGLGDDFGPVDRDMVAVDRDSHKNHPVDDICMAIKGCVTGSGHHRQVVSHVFGRNKKCTRALKGYWIMWCRQHYQRFSYRGNKEPGRWAWSQLSLARAQLQKFEEAGIVVDWDIILRKHKQEALDAENTALLMADQSAADGTAKVMERHFQQFLGRDKSFAEVRAVLDAIEDSFQTPEFKARDKKDMVFPGIEFLANFAEDKKQKKKKANKAAGPKSTLRSGAKRAAFNKPTDLKPAVLKSIATKASNLERTNRRTTTKQTSAKSSEPLAIASTLVNSVVADMAACRSLVSLKRKGPPPNTIAGAITFTPANAPTNTAATTPHLADFKRKAPPTDTTTSVISKPSGGDQKRRRLASGLHD